jgi:hypothetical protein
MSHRKIDFRVGGGKRKAFSFYFAILVIHIYWTTNVQ